MDYWRGYWTLNASDTTLHDEQERIAFTSTNRTGNQIEHISIMTKSDGNTYNYRFMGLFNDSSAGDLFMATETFDEVKDSTIQITSTLRINVGIYSTFV
jgi:hypothetical protein